VEVVLPPVAMAVSGLFLPNGVEESKYFASSSVSSPIFGRGIEEDFSLFSFSLLFFSLSIFSGRFPELSGNFRKPSGKNRQRKEKQRKRKQRKVLLYPPTDYRRTHGGGSEIFAFFHPVGEK
jgi:hypothetical protein